MEVQRCSTRFDRPPNDMAASSRKRFPRDPGDPPSGLWARHSLRPDAPRCAPAADLGDKKVWFLGKRNVTWGLLDVIGWRQSPRWTRGHNAGSSRSRGSRGNPSPSQAGMRTVASEISQRFSMISRCKSLCLRPKLSVSRLSQPQATSERSLPFGWRRESQKKPFVR